ncbi:retrotransposon unclassified [Plasmopara halstedii]|uniref:Retrotransposon unclassified n=1 Tax=Plasmopara halstedii TaxID=4781 RepID=A0A0P1B0I7_PLAHL|nr:retrotransposon unclassified [Plasmopara halstedii]CEG48196.1 retrotransposon unclassified [Plasmopara halstedii]|eukprot:XP_024584565.1 retrotransposon unclassified [Plasmopara halstedii]
MMTAVDIRNVIPSASSPNASPFELVFKRKPRFQHMRVFGSQCYAHVAMAVRGKLDNSGVRCLMLDCSKQHKAYRLLNESTKAIIISRSVAVAENAPAMKTHRQGAPSLIDVVGDDKHDQESSDTKARESYQTPPTAPRGTPTRIEEVLNERSRGSVPTQRSSTPGRDDENESHVRLVRKNHAVLRYGHDFPNLRHGKFGLGDYEAGHDALYCFSAEDDGESTSTFEKLQQSKYRDEWLRVMESEI